MTAIPNRRIYPFASNQLWCSEQHPLYRGGLALDTVWVDGRVEEDLYPDGVFMGMDRTRRSRHFEARGVWTW